MVGCYDLLFLRFRVTLFWIQYKAFVTILAPYLLAPAFIVPVFYHVFTATMATLTCAYCLNHLLSLSLITYLATLPKILRRWSRASFPNIIEFHLGSQRVDAIRGDTLQIKCIGLEKIVQSERLGARKIIVDSTMI